MASSSAQKARSCGWALGEDDEVLLSRGWGRLERGAHPIRGDPGARRRRVGHPVRRCVGRQAQPVGEGAPQVVPQQRGGVRPASGPLEEVPHGGDELRPRDLHRLGLEHRPAQAPRPP